MHKVINVYLKPLEVIKKENKYSVLKKSNNFFTTPGSLRFENKLIINTDMFHLFGKKQELLILLNNTEYDFRLKDGHWYFVEDWCCENFTILPERIAR